MILLQPTNRCQLSKKGVTRNGHVDIVGYGKTVTDLFLQQLIVNEPGLAVGEGSS